MKKCSNRPLVALNLGLLGVVVTLAMGSGPVQPAARARGAYTMVSGAIQGGGNSDVVYVLDSANQELIAVRWDNARNDLDVIGFRSLTADSKQRSGR